MTFARDITTTAARPQPLTALGEPAVSRVVPSLDRHASPRDDELSTLQLVARKEA